MKMKNRNFPAGPVAKTWCFQCEGWALGNWDLTWYSSIQFSRSVVSDSSRPHESQHSRLPCPSPTPGVHSNSCPSSQWCHPAISSSVVPFSSCPQSLPAWESFPMSQLFAWGGQSIGVSALASVLPKNTQDWSSEWTGWISLQSKGLSRVFSDTNSKIWPPLFSLSVHFLHHIFGDPRLQLPQGAQPTWRALYRGFSGSTAGMSQSFHPVLLLPPRGGIKNYTSFSFPVWSHQACLHNWPLS